MNTQIISVANQKGGVGKTTTALNLATALSMNNYKVLVIDFDPQGNLSKYAGYEGNDLTVSDLLFGQATGRKVNIDDCIRHSDINKIDYIPSDINLSSADLYLASALSRETMLKRLLNNDTIHSYDYVIIDCNPQLGVLLMNALTTSDKVIIPVETQDFALDGLSALDDVISQIKAQINPSLDILGVLPTKYEEVTNASKRVLQSLKKQYGDKVFNTLIHRATKATESVNEQKSLCLMNCRTGNEYKELALEVIERSKT